MNMGVRPLKNVSMVYTINIDIYYHVINTKQINRCTNYY